MKFSHEGFLAGTRIGIGFMAVACTPQLLWQGMLAPIELRALFMASAMTLLIDFTFLSQVKPEDI